MTETIAIIAWGAMADVLYATPIVRHIRRLHPDATITWLVRDKFAEIIETNPDIDDVDPFTLPLGHVNRQDAEYVMDQLILETAKTEYDRYFDLQYWPRHSNFYEYPTEDFISLRARNAGLDPSAITDRSIVLETTEYDSKLINDFILDNHLDGKLIAINHISYASSFVWSFDQYQQLTNILQGSNIKCVFTGAPNEPLPQNAYDARGMPYRQWMKLIACSDFYLGLDSGAKTLAAATDTPMIILHSKDFPLQKTGCQVMRIRTYDIWELTTIPSVETIINLMESNGL